MSCNGVLVVEDDADIRINVNQALQLEGYTVLEAIDGVDALAVLAALPRENLPGCILLDIQMPRMSGDEFYHVLQKDYSDTWAKIPLIVATAKGNLTSSSPIPKTIERIQKPMDLDELFRAVEKYCGKPR